MSETPSRPMNNAVSRRNCMVIPVRMSKDEFQDTLLHGGVVALTRTQRGLASLLRHASILRFTRDNRITVR
jgi:hypothetical protein